MEATGVMGICICCMTLHPAPCCTQGEVALLDSRVLRWHSQEQGSAAVGLGRQLQHRSCCICCPGAADVDTISTVAAAAAGMMPWRMSCLSRRCKPVLSGAVERSTCCAASASDSATQAVAQHLRCCCLPVQQQTCSSRGNGGSRGRGNGSNILVVWSVGSVTKVLASVHTAGLG
jgi:hypothetical protein